ncbi:MAG: hypothetical protein ACKONH_00235 [Planctomycetia bacterium]
MQCFIPRLGGLCAAVVLTFLPARAAELAILLPLGRQAYQTNETIDVSVVRAAKEPLAAGTLSLEVAGADGSSLSFAFPIRAAAVGAEGEARATEHLHVDGRMLRPGKYTIRVAADAATAEAAIDVHSHLRESSFRIISWGGRGQGADQIRCGRDAAGVNLMMAHYKGFDQDGNIRGGMDFMRNCLMGGGHQMDGRLECDWSDPAVLAGGQARAARRTLVDRTSPNTIGVHFYDEPGLTWHEHPQTKVFSPHNIPAQDRAYEAAFGRPAVPYTSVKPGDAESVARWDEVQRWKQVFMEAAWRISRFSVDWVDPRMMSVTQSQYAWYAFGDGYYFNIVRPLPVVSGHGGYHDLAGGYLCPSYFLEFGRIREWDKPCWYLPLWYEDSPSEVFRMEQYLSFMTNVQGMAIPPGIAVEDPHKQAHGDGVIESNRLMLRLGTIFTTMPVERHEVAVLYAMSQNVKAMVESKDMNNAQDFPGQIERLLQLYVVGKMAHIPLMPVVEEDVLDGTLAANHRAVVITGVDVLEPRVVRALEDWIKAGGRVILADECQVQIAGAVKLGAAINDAIYVASQKEFGIGDQATRRGRCCSARAPGPYFRAGAPIAAALTARCAEIGIRPVADVSEPQVLASRHRHGDVEYLFLVNATQDEQALAKLDWNGIRAARASVALPADGRPVYDAVRGGAATEFVPSADKLTADLRFGPGQMRAFARPARPMGGVRIAQASLGPADYVRPGRPTRAVRLRAEVTDAAGAILCGSIPLEIALVDPLGQNRHRFYRATDGGTIAIELPLGVNEPAGQWRIRVRELLAGTEGTATFSLAAPATCGAAAGATRRAVMFSGDAEPMFRFFRLHRKVALVIGTSDYNRPAAERLAKILAPWGVACEIVEAAAIQKRERPEDVRRTWAGDVQNPDLAMPGEAAILLGTPEDNPVIKSLTFTHVGPRALPYVPELGKFPGRGRGYLSWQVDTVAFNNYETITCIAHDAEGMAEAVGTVFEAASGFRDATPYALPGHALVKPATAAVPAVVPEPKVCWKAALPDRAVSLEAAGDQLRLVSLDGSLTTLAADGKAVSRADADPRQAQELFVRANQPREAPAVAEAIRDPHKVPKFVAAREGTTAVAYWGGFLRLSDAQGKTVCETMLPQDVAGLAWQGPTLVVPLADGQVVGLAAP